MPNSFSFSWGRELFARAKLTEAALKLISEDRLFAVRELIAQSEMSIAVWNDGDTDRIYNMVLKGRRYWMPEYSGPQPSKVAAIICESIHQAAGYRKLFGDEAAMVSGSPKPLRRGHAVPCEISEYISFNQ
ncbi:hypothetical protein [Bosea sp. (in: a-proteobacteria)]|uniref:hypothetical protein n=1 Tax=Bosea sp. (in: a-proteobacteria) TaxID=1871050 RepID=UPI001AC46D6A|nr:hypothetical protein [Bosea sp. (in: a-proteobacteria)]MBN9438487.1 hypothetical protein [Bosea sp. (in: a-proteobacteria)]